MSDLKICRICLCKDAKMFDKNRYHLNQYYEEIMTMKVSNKDGLPHYFCYMCATMLHKFHKFKEKCHMGQKILQELLWEGPISSISISQVNIQSKSLKSPIDIITKSKRVKTLCLKYEPLSHTLDKTDKTTQTEEINSSDDENLAEKHIFISKEKEVNDSKQIKNDVIPKTILSTEEKPLPDFVDDRMYSDEDDFNTANDIEKINVKEEVIEDPKIDEESSQTTEEIKTIELPTHDNSKGRKRKPKISKKEPIAKKARKFEIKAKTNYLDPEHWLKINLTEEEALEEFKAREKDQKYIKLAYKCTLCLKGFSKEDMLTRHSKLRHSGSIGPFKCHFCSMYFKLKCFLSKHLRQHFTKYKCLRCEVICPLENTALFHNEFHNGVVRKCNFCGEEFRHLSSFYTHLRLHRSEHICTLCGASFVSALGLHQHKKTMHIDIVINLDDEGSYCERCDIKFETQMAYTEHFAHSAMHGAEGTAAKETDASVSKNYNAKGQTETLKKKIIEFKRRNPRKPTPCTICHKNFPSMKAYMKHHNAKHTEKPTSKRKMRTEKTNYEERQICEICGASLAPGSVKSHLNAHTSEKIFTCPTCGRAFHVKGSMERHQLVHTGEKPHKCTLCEKRFTQHGSVKLHYRTVHLKEPHPKRNRRKEVKLGTSSRTVQK